MTGRRSHGRLSALNGVVHQGMISLDLMQRTMLTREPTLQTDAMTWTTGAIGTGGGDTLTPVRERLHAEVDTFIRAY